MIQVQQSASVPFPASLMNQEHHNRFASISEWIPWTGAAILMAAVLVVLFGANWVPFIHTAEAPLELRASDVNGTLRIRWNPRAADIAHAQTAVLEVLDGGEHYRYPVSAGVLASGALDYIRKADEVTAALILYKNGQEIGRRIVLSVARVANV